MIPLTRSRPILQALCQRSPTLLFFAFRTEKAMFILLCIRHSYFDGRFLSNLAHPCLLRFQARCFGPGHVAGAACRAAKPPPAHDGTQAARGSQRRSERGKESCRSFRSSPADALLHPQENALETALKRQSRTTRRAAGETTCRVDRRAEEARRERGPNFGRPARRVRLSPADAPFAGTAESWLPVPNGTEAGGQDASAKVGMTRRLEVNAHSGETRRLGLPGRTRRPPRTGWAALAETAAIHRSRQRSQADASCAVLGARPERFRTPPRSDSQNSPSSSSYHRNLGESPRSVFQFLRPLTIVSREFPATLGENPPVAATLVQTTT